jgi:uncharacterized membrane protein YphA (DoxX/SURF4 family)
VSIVDLSWFCRLVLAFSFLASAYSAVTDWTGFRFAANRLWGEKSSMPNGIVPAVPVVETIVGSVLLLPARALVGSAGLVAVTLLIAFTALLARVLFQGREGVTCHCFGSGGENVSAISIARNSIFVAMGIVVASAAFTNGSPGDDMKAALVWAGPAVASALLLAEMSLIVRMITRPPRGLER